ncbi:MAG: terpene cyclase/mutase family protein, partial [Pirellulales bacterium]|nr:terpene cyclase/mutase family protein [Pirellulales bacterium]
LALLALMGAGHNHLDGQYADNVYRGLAYLIRDQKPNGSMAGSAAVYAANYSHGMAALAMCEAAAITRDVSAIESARRAVNYSISQQHPQTGGWRYLPNDPGDLSQLGWQAMVLDAGHRAGIEVDRQSVLGVQRFLRSVRAGRTGGLASYRANERPSRTMTAEALATRLLIGESIPPAEIKEAESYLLQQPPGVGKDNYYYWYYATLALHQLQDDAWNQWNAALQKRLLETQRPDGSWPADTMWGGYGGTVYTTAMAALCLEAYYRHVVRENPHRIADRPNR